MKKFYLVAVSMIITHFVLKLNRKLKHPETYTEDQKLETILDAMHDDYKQWLNEHKPSRNVAEVDPDLLYHDPSAALASIHGSF